MFVSKLRIQNFRSLKNTTLEPGRHLNFVTGPNGAGKTSVIEALFFLSQGKSFKVQTPRSMIRDGETGFTVAAEIVDDFGNANYASVALGKDGRTLSYNNESNVSVLTVCNAIPVQIVAPDTIDLLLEGPEVRRSYLNWGMFYVHPQFISIYNEFLRYHKQRLSVLMKCKAVIDSGRMVSDELQATLVLYTKRVAEFTDKLLVLYNAYTSELIPVLKQVLQEFLPELKFDIKFYQGWNERFTALENLELNLGRDMTNGRCYTGLHRFDFVLKCYGEPVQNVLSRGQLKLLACAMKLAQGEHLSNKAKNSCVYLVDDLAAELDAEKQLRFAQRLIRENNQIFMSYINAKDLEIYRALVKDWHEFKIVDGDVIHLASDGVAQPVKQTYENYLNLLGQVEWGELADADFEAKVKDLQEQFATQPVVSNQDIVEQAKTKLEVVTETQELDTAELETTASYLTELGLWSESAESSEAVESSAETENSSQQQTRDLCVVQSDTSEHENKVESSVSKQHNDNESTALENKSEANGEQFDVEAVAQELLKNTSTETKLTDAPEPTSRAYEVEDFGVSSVVQKLHEFEVPADWQGEEEFATRKNSVNKAVATHSFELTQMMEQYIDHHSTQLNESTLIQERNEVSTEVQVHHSTVTETIPTVLTAQDLHSQEVQKELESRAQALFAELEISELEVELDSFDSLTEPGVDSLESESAEMESTTSQDSSNLFTVIEDELAQDYEPENLLLETALHQDVALNSDNVATNYLQSNLNNDDIKAHNWVEATDLTAFFDADDVPSDPKELEKFSVQISPQDKLLGYKTVEVSEDAGQTPPFMNAKLQNIFGVLTQETNLETNVTEVACSTKLQLNQNYEFPKQQVNDPEDKLSTDKQEIVVQEQEISASAAPKAKRIVPFWIKRKGK